MSVGTLLTFLDDTVVNTALPRISVTLHASTSGLQWVVDAYVLVLAGLLLLCGSIGDRYGRKRAMTLGLMAFGAAAIGASRSMSIGQLITARAFQGLGAALILPATLSIITNVFPREDRARAIAVWTAIGGLGIGFGPVLGGYLVDAASWHAVFWLFVPLVVVALGGMSIVPESRDERGIGLDMSGAILATAGLTALVYGIIRAGEVGWGNRWGLASFGAAALLLVAFAAVEGRTPAPMLPLNFFRERDFSGAVILIGMVLFAMFVTFFFLTQLFQLVQHRSALAAGLLIVPTSIAVTISAGIAGKVIHTLGPRVLALAMTTGMLGGLLILTRTTETTSTVQIVTALVVFGFGAGLALPALTDTVMAAVPEREAGVGSAVNDVSRQLGGALGVAVIGSFVSNAYRAKLHDGLRNTGVPLSVAHAAAASIGVANQAARALPRSVATVLTTAADHAFVSAITRGFEVSTVVVVLAAVVAATLVPRRMRVVQIEGHDERSPTRRLTDAEANRNGMRPRRGPRTTTPNESRRAELAKGGVAVAVLRYMTAHPTREYTAIELARALDRSRSAIANALARFAVSGDVLQTADRPRRYKLTRGGSPRE
jgi:EmrB/QacA subfamily drug resistance transporter